MKTKLISKILCGVLAVMTITSGGMMFAGAYSEYDFDMYSNKYSYPEPKYTTSGVWVNPTSGGTLFCRIYEGQCYGGTFYDSKGGYYEILEGDSYCLPNYVHEDGCALAAVYGWDYEGGNEHTGNWMPDV